MPHRVSDLVRKAIHGTVAIVLLCAFATGCAHQTTITSTNPGAEVYVEGEMIGRTPVEFESSTSHNAEIHFDVRQAGESKRFALQRDQIDGLALFGAIGVGVGAVGASIGLFTMSSMALVLSVAVIQVDIPAGLSLLATSGGLMALASVISSFAITLPVMMVGEFGYALPERVDVDWVSGEVLTDGGGEVRPLIGAPQGFSPHRPKNEDGYE